MSLGKTLDVLGGISIVLCLIFSMDEMLCKPKLSRYHSGMKRGSFFPTRFLLPKFTAVFPLLLSAWRKSATAQPSFSHHHNFRAQFLVLLVKNVWKVENSFLASMSRVVSAWLISSRATFWPATKNVHPFTFFWPARRCFYTHPVCV